MEKSRAKLGYPTDRQLLAVLEEDGTEVEEEDYFQVLYMWCLYCITPVECCTQSILILNL